MDHYLVFAVIFTWVGTQKKIIEYFQSKGKRTMYISFDDLIPSNQHSIIRYVDVVASVNCQADQTVFDSISDLNKNSYYHPHTVDTDMFKPMKKEWDYQLLHSFEPHRIIKRNKKGQLVEHKLNLQESVEMAQHALTYDSFYRDYRIIPNIFDLPGNNLRGGYFWDNFPIQLPSNWTALDDYREGIYNSADWTQTMDLFGKSKYTIHLYRKIHGDAHYFYTERPIFSFSSGCIIIADDLGNNEFLSQHGLKWGHNIFKITHETTKKELKLMREDIKINYKSILNETRKIVKWWDYRNWDKRFREIMLYSQPGDYFENPPIKNP